MFRARMTRHELRRAERGTDKLGFSYESYGEPEQVPLYLSRPTIGTLNQNEFYVKRYDATAFTFADVSEGDLIDSSWRVDTVFGIGNGELALGLVAFGGEHDGRGN